MLLNVILAVLLCGSVLADLNALPPYNVDKELNIESNEVKLGLGQEYNGSGSEVTEAVRPGVSSSVLFQILQNIWETTGVAASGNTTDDLVAIKNQKHFGKCLDMRNGRHTNLNKVISYTCKAYGHNQMVWIRHAGSGYVSIVFTPNLCMGSGFDVGAKVHVTMGDEWCKNSKSHQFAIIVKENYVWFQQAENGLCLTSPDNGHDVVVDFCGKGNKAQEWKICDPTGKKCWPNNNKV